MERHAKVQAIYLKYKALSDAAYKRGVARVCNADKRLGNSGYALLCAHNWGNDAAKKELARMDKLSSYIYNRSDRECNIAEHLEHIEFNEVGNYLWCKECQKLVS